jgi:hypothetical protein
LINELLVIGKDETRAKARVIPQLTAGGNSDADIATPIKDALLFPSTESATPTPVYN